MVHGAVLGGWGDMYYFGVDFDFIEEGLDS